MHTIPIIITVAMLAASLAIPWIRSAAERRRAPWSQTGPLESSEIGSRGIGLPEACGMPSDTVSGIGSAIAAIIARTASGGSAVDAFQEQLGARFATPRITAERAAEMLRRHASKNDTEHDIAHTAGQLASACALSERLGCEVSRCLQSVSDSYRRECKARDLRREAFAAPKATIRLLSALPLATVLLGELMGAKPVAFLLGSPTGLPCLFGGICWYGLGLLWIRRLFTRFAAERHGGAQVPLMLEMLGAAILQGAPIPTALSAVGESLDGRLAAALHHAGEALLSQVTWHEAWIGAYGAASQRMDGPTRAQPIPRRARDAPIGMTGLRDRMIGMQASAESLRRGTGTPARKTVGVTVRAGTPVHSDAEDAELQRQVTLVANCLEGAWVHGSSPTAQLRLAIAEYDSAQRSAIEQAAARLSIQLLSPTGLCFLPAFILIGIVPAIASFAA